MNSAENAITPALKKWAQTCAMITSGIGFLGILGWFGNIPVLAQILSDSVLIPLRAALLFLFIGKAVFLFARKPAARDRRFLLAFMGIASILFTFVNKFPFPMALGSIEPILLRNLNMWEYLYRDQMSPLDVQTFFVLGLSLFLMAFITPRRKVLGGLVGGTALLVLLVHMVVILGFSYGTPLSYPEGFKPSSFSAGIAFMAMGSTLIALLGHAHFPLQYLSGSSVRAQLLRTFLPIGVASILIYSFLLHTVFRFINPALTASLSAFMATVMVGLLVIRASEVVSHRIDSAVRRSEEQFGVLVESLRDYAIFMLDPQGHVMTWSAGAERFKGYKAAEIIGEDFSVFYPPEDRARGKPASILAMALSHGSHQDQGWRVRKDGSRFWAEILITAIYNSAGGLRGFSKVVRDMTERKKAEESLLQKTAFVQMLQTVSSAANESSTLEEAMRICLDEVCQHTGWAIGHALLVEGDGQSLKSAYWHHNSAQHFEAFEKKSRTFVFHKGAGLPGRVLETGKPAWTDDLPKNLDFPRAEEAKAEGIRASCAFPILSGKDVVGVLEFFSQEVVEPDIALLDIMVHIGTQLGRVAERQKAHAIISSSLWEKEVLLKEIHHRVKNNLQIISSLLRLQSEKVTDASTLSMLRESQNRVQSMALIHECLYQSPDLAHIPISEYIHSLVSGLTRSYGFDPDALEVSLEIDPVRLELDTAIPCGLIITELVSNALKYAFPKLNGNRGRLVVGFHQESPNTYALKVKDNGAGLPLDIQIDKTNSLGLRLVRALTHQLGGQMHMHRNGGTEFQIVFTET